MKNLYRYFLAGEKFIVRSYSHKVNSDVMRRYLEVNKELYEIWDAVEQCDWLTIKPKQSQQ